MVCVIGAVILEMTEITVEVKCHLVLMLREDFELNGKFRRKNIPKLISSNDATEKMWIRLTGLNDIFTSCDSMCLLLIRATQWNQLGQDLSLSQIFMQNLTVLLLVVVHLILY